MSDAAAHGTHLYVMQSSCGRIKIGRSSNPKKRLQAVQTGSGRKVKLAAVIEGWGVREQDIHRSLASHHAIGEWFRNTERCRAAIEDILGRPVRFPYPLDRDRKSVAEARVDAAVAAAIAKMKAERANPSRRRMYVPTGPKADPGRYQIIEDVRNKMAAARLKRA